MKKIIFTLLIAGAVLSAQSVPSQSKANTVHPQIGPKQGPSGPQKETPVVYRKWVDIDVRWIISSEEREKFLNLSTDAERDQFIIQFWEQRNPTPGTERNPFKEEHYRRIAYSNEHFASNNPGWKTDRGRTYIIYGPPSSIASEPAVSGNASHPAQTWRYKSPRGFEGELVFRFVDQCDCGDYELEGSTK